MDRFKAMRAGFTLIEIIIAIGIIAVLAGAITPLAFKEFMRAKEESTLLELADLEAGLLDFYDDTGRFPTEAEGLSALVADPGATGWRGPYFGADGSDPVQDVTEDSFGNPYLYDLAPTTVPAGAASVLVASGGADHTVTFGTVGGTWTIAGDGDDLLQLVAAGPLDRDKQVLAEEEMALIAAAVAKYYEDKLAFPTLSTDLAPDYMDAGIGGGAFIDPWNLAYVLDEDGGSPPTLTIQSFGPDRTDDGGGGDDLALDVSSIPPGRTATSWRLAIAQSALNADPGLVLTGVWATDLQALGLTSVFQTDGWGQDFLVNTSVRAVLSAGPDGDPLQTDDNLPAGMGPS